ncbi:MAG: DNA/RNA nuclease SfsA [Idiomarinaceae bacterium]|nr:DNA/RNA nuclease SfsA [Idiomarinaceae bacterium]
MQFNTPLEVGILRQRYKRFLADIEFTTQPQSIETVHCPNTGAMTGCAEPGYKVWCSVSDNPKRKYAKTWELAQNFSGDWIVINTQRANQVAGEALKRGLVTELADFNEWLAEQRYGEQNSRIDWLGTSADGNRCYVEVKSVTLVEQQCGYFPDTVSARAIKHVQELEHMCEQGHRAVMLYVCMHSGADQIKPAAHIDPNYANACINAAQKGVEFYALNTDINEQGIRANGVLPVMLSNE